MSYDNTLRGALFVNDDKRSASHPDYKGSIETNDGEQFWCSAWIKEIKSGKNIGNKFLSLALTPKDNNAQTGKSVNRETNTDAASFLEANRGKADSHRAALPSHPAQPNPDYDSFDDDIPF